MLETVEKSYYYRLAFRCIITILAGAVVAELALYFSLYRGPGSSYAESYTIIASLRSELFHKSTVIYITASCFIIAGIAVISLLYSHRVAGPVYRLGVFARQIAAGDLAGKVKLRQHDVIHMMADDLNNLTVTYKEVIRQLEDRTKEFRNITSLAGVSEGDEARYAVMKLWEKKDEINRILSHIKL